MKSLHIYIIRCTLLVAMLFTVSWATTKAQDTRTPYAVLSSENTVLTFYYDDQKETRNGMSVGPFDLSSTDNRGWSPYIREITKAVFDASFADCASLTSTAWWFYNCYRLTTIENLQYLNTSNVTDMTRMFDGCEVITELDLKNFDTGRVVDMTRMFYDCHTLTNLDVTSFNTTNVSNMRQMFGSCAGLTSLNLGSFNTANVTNMNEMFIHSSNLETVIVGPGWTVDNVQSGTSSDGTATGIGVYMFADCTKLRGGMGTTFDSNHVNIEYAHIDGGESNPGYFTAMKAVSVTASFPFNEGTEGQNAVFSHPDYFLSSQVTHGSNLSIEGNRTCAETQETLFTPVESHTDNLTDDDAVTFLISTKAGVTFTPTKVSFKANRFGTDMGTIDAYWLCPDNTTIELERGIRPERDNTGINTVKSCDITGMTHGEGECGLKLFLYDYAPAKHIGLADIIIEGTLSGEGVVATEAYAAFNNDSTVLTFYYDDQKTAKKGMSVADRGWLQYAGSIIKVQFDSSFADYYPTSTNHWFDECSNLTSVIDIENLKLDRATDISWMFRKCSGLTTLDVRSWNTANVTEMGGLFYGCTSLTSLDVSSFNTQKVTNMESMFGECHALTSVDVSSFNTENVTNMDFMFGATAISELNLSNFNTDKVTNMRWMFSGVGVTSVLKTVNLSGFNTSKVTNMEGMFNSNPNLTTIYVGEDWSTSNVTNGADMFTNCTNLKGGAGTPYDANHTDYTYAHIDGGESNPGYFTAATDIIEFADANVKTLCIRNWDTDGDNELSKSEAAVVTTLGEIFKGNTTITTFDELQYFTGLTIVGKEAFSNCTNLSTVTIPNSVEIIDNSAFYSCGLTEITLPESVDSLGNSAIAYCNNLASITICCSPSRHDYYAISYNTNIKDVIFDCEVVKPMIKDGLAGENIRITKKVKIIEDGSLNSYIDAMDMISNNVSTIIVEEGNEQYNSQNNCNAIIETATNTLIRGCKNTVIPSTVTALGKGAFAGCTELTAMALPNGVKTIGEGAFYRCKKMKSLEMNEGLETVGPVAFARCDSMSTITFPNSVTSIGVEVLYSSKVDSVIFGSGLTNLGDAPFKGDHVKDVYCYASTPPTVEGHLSLPPSYDSQTGELIDSDVTLHVPGSSLAAYKASEGWSEFERIKGKIVAIEGTEVTPEPYALLSDNNTVLTFYYDDQMNTRGGMSVADRGWSQYASSITKVQFDSTFVNYYPTSTREWFNGCLNLTSIVDMKYLKLDRTTDMSGMFLACTSLTSLDVSGFNTQQVTNMQDMFRACTNLTSLDLSKFNTQNVTEMYGMFYNCTNLKSLDLSNFDTRNVRNMDHLFRFCTNLVNLNISGFSTANGASQRNMFEGCSSLASIQAGNAVIADSTYAQIGNPNLLLYVNEASQAPQSVRNVVVLDEAEQIVLTDMAQGNNNFYCPKQFTAKSISYTRNFKQMTQVGVSRGWETIALPFAVQTITHEKNGTLTPFGVEGGKPFWLRELTGNGLVSARHMDANVPYLISMPNNSIYPDDYNQAGNVTFSATNAVVPVTESRETSGNNRTLIPTMMSVAQSPDIYVINRDTTYQNNPQGSIFVADYREVRPFEAYVKHVGGARYFSLSEIPQLDVTGIESIELKPWKGEQWWTLDGRKLNRRPSKKGIYIRNGKKVVVDATF